MIATAAFALLALLSLASVFAILLSHRLTTATAAFGLYTVAIVGIYFLLNLRFAAAAQLIVNAGLGAALWIGTRTDDTAPEPKASNPWYALAALPFAALACWSVAQGTAGEAALELIPVWATRGSYLQSLGEQLLAGYLVPFLLVALLLLAAAVAISYLSEGDADSGEGRSS